MTNNYPSFDEDLDLSGEQKSCVTLMRAYWHQDRSWGAFSAIFERGEISDNVISSLILDAQTHEDARGAALATALMGLRASERRALLEVDTDEKFGISDELYASLDEVKAMWDSLMAFRPSPFENNASSFSCDVFCVQAYSWADGDQAYNFKWRDIEVHWYKYFGRAMWVSRPVVPEEVTNLSTECCSALVNGVTSGAFRADH